MFHILNQGNILVRIKVLEYLDRIMAAFCCGIRKDHSVTHVFTPLKLSFE